MARYLEILYNFFVTDGTVSTRDLAYAIPDEISGLCVDVGRAVESSFDYAALEGYKFYIFQNHNFAPIQYANNE